MNGLYIRSSTSEIILTEFEKVVATIFVQSGILDIILYMSMIRCISEAGSNLQDFKGAQFIFLKDLWFTVEKFENEDVHFLDINVMNNDKTNIYIKYTNGGLYINQDNFELQ